MVLKNFKPELSYILAELFNRCLKESCFPNYWKFSPVVSVFKKERSTTKNYCPIPFFLWLVNFFEKLVNNRIVDHLEQCVTSFMSSQSAADLLTVVFDGTARAFNRSRATWAVALDKSMAIDRVWHAGLLQT